VREKMQEVFYDPGFVTPTWVEEIRRLLIAPSSAIRVLRFAQASKRQSLEEHLPDIRVPTLLVWGREDRITPPEVAEQFHALIPDSRLVFLPQCGHTPMLEQPNAFHAAVSAWLAETRPRRPRPEATVGALR
jgi:pimeloyl-ACP methyl ester carboxylesterase